MRHIDALGILTVPNANWEKDRKGSFERIKTFDSHENNLDELKKKHFGQPKKKVLTKLQTSKRYFYCSWSTDFFRGSRR